MCGSNCFFFFMCFKPHNSAEFCFYWAPGCVLTFFRASVGMSKIKKQLNAKKFPNANGKENIYLNFIAFKLCMNESTNNDCNYFLFIYFNVNEDPTYYTLNRVY